MGHIVNMYLILEYSSSLLSYLLKTTLMHVYVVDEALFRACEIHSPWLRGSGPRTWPIWPYILGGECEMHVYYVHEALIHDTP